MAQENIWIGFDLGGTKMLAVVFDDQFQVMGTSRKKTKGHEGAKSGMARVNATIAAAMVEANVKPDQISGLGIGCPGPLDLKQGVIREAPNLGWVNVPIANSISGEFGFPVRVGNDVDFGVFGEYHFGAARGARCAVGIFPGTGIGGGCVYEGKLIQGANSTCMEIGHIPLPSSTALHGDGRWTSLEACASRLAISGEAAQAAFRGQAEHLLEIAGTDISKIRSAQLADSIRAGDEAIRDIVERAARVMSLGVVTLVHLLAPDIVILGGGLVEAMPDLYLESVTKTANKQVLPSFRNSFRIAPAELGDQATAMGAAAAAKQTFS
ncbi:MAG TPA: ROK family protein [Pirellulaceae bacterium]|nr:ROK family protein [Pirellulaceae bacterium]